MKKYALILGLGIGIFLLPHVSFAATYNFPVYTWDGHNYAYGNVPTGMAPGTYYFSCTNPSFPDIYLVDGNDHDVDGLYYGSIAAGGGWTASTITALGGNEYSIYLPYYGGFTSGNVEVIALGYNTGSGYLNQGSGTTSNCNGAGDLVLSDTPSSSGANLTNPEQYLSDGMTLLPDGETTTATSVIFSAMLNGTGTLQLQAEVKPTGFPFTDTPNVTSTWVSPSSTATTSFIGSNGSYHWQARAVNSNGSSSAWESFGVSGTSTVDFTIAASPPEESVHFDGDSGLEWNVSTTALNDTSPFTIEFWYKAATSSFGDLINAVNTSTGQGFVVAKDEKGIDLTLSCGATTTLEFSGAQHWSQHGDDDSIPPDDGPYWHYVALTKGSSDAAPFDLYFDGAEQTTTDCFDSSAATPIWLGQSPTSSNGFLGDLAEVRIWDVQRSSSDLNTFAQEEISPTSTGLIAYMSLNGTTTELVSGNATSAQEGDPQFATSSPMGPHYVDFQYAPSVNNGAIRWYGSTQFSGEWNDAVNTWNALGAIDIASTSASSTADLIIQDINTSTFPFVGFDAAWTSSSTGPDNIYFNEFYLSSSTYSGVQNTATHELGHALGLDHSVFGNVMYYLRTSQTVLGPQDISDYNYLWGN